jgi:integrase/recombinase XerD
MSMRTISSLRQSMIDDMTARQVGPRTQQAYIRSCKRFTVFLGRSPETATAEDIRRFQLDLAASAPSIFGRNNIVTGVKFLFRVTLRRLDLVAEFFHVRQSVTIPPVLNADEVECLLTAAKSLRVRVMLPPCVLALSRQWWLERSTDQDAGMAQDRWLFPGRVPGKPVTTRQLNRLVHEAARAAGSASG